MAASAIEPDEARSEIDRPAIRQILQNVPRGLFARRGTGVTASHAPERRQSLFTGRAHEGRNAGGCISRKRGARVLHLPAIPSPSENTQVKRNRSGARKLFTCVYHHGDGGQEKRSANETGNRHRRSRESRADGGAPTVRARATPAPPGSVPDPRGRTSQGRKSNRPRHSRGTKRRAAGGDSARGHGRGGGRSGSRGRGARGERPAVLTVHLAEHFADKGLVVEIRVHAGHVAVDPLSDLG